MNKPLKPETVRQRMRAIDRDRKALDIEMRTLLARCPHDWLYLSDPSGNNDSEYHCTICGKYVRRLP